MTSSKIRSRFPLLLVGVLLISSVACSNQQPQAQSRSQSELQNSANLRVTSTDKPTATEIQTTTFTDSNKTVWIPLEHVVKALGLRSEKSRNLVKIGYTDVMFQVHPNQRSAMSFGRPLSLSQAPIIRNGEVYTTSQSLSELLHTKIRLNAKSGSLHVSPLTNERNITNAQSQNNQGYRILTTTEDTDELIAFAKKFLGVPYEFGAPDYNESKTFDCSSFTQYVFKRFNKNLPRLAREQADRGRPVDRSELIAGDLIFFTVKGRFQSDDIPGHVGIYIGDGKFIHTWGDPGVQISPLDTGYWKDVTLFMRRI